ncbi:hypothetical protein [Caldisalinibacter kiritimatiensis]|uniref:Uncharacterized protein n=1 Tax=Caldisalinibacter kiritimatiensis TaxID=1304284 RepID=R1CPV3_9FIRM|nr:hypothetical protein [Caldisalinibacter kiritimatiensis]EOD00706.1 hypothetical protein L21TH_1244 [Caldisalinibacter kiritimatiensis]
MIYPIPWLLILIVSIPEAFLVLKLGFKLCNTNISTKHSLITSIIVGISSYYIRKTDIVFGLHTLITIILLTFLIWILTRIKFIHALMATLIGSLISGVLQSTISTILLSLTKKTFSDIVSNPILGIFYFLPSGLMMMFLYFYLKYRKVYVLDLKMYSED